MSNTKERNSSIELLRIIAEIGVVFLHYNSIAFNIVEENSVNYYYLLFVESIFICAVDLFIIISAFYLSTTNKRKLSKICQLILELLFINCAAYLFDVLISRNKDFTVGELINNFLPLNYFVILYSIIYLISPYINILLEKLNKKQAKRLLIIMFLLFSVWSYVVDILNIFIDCNAMSSIGLKGSQEGYTIVNFSLLYLIGYSIKTKIIDINKKMYIRGWILSLIIIFVLSTIINFRSWNYNSPFVILNAVCIFGFFKEFNFKNKLINELSKASFTCYLFHNKLLSLFKIKWFTNDKLFVLLIHEIVTGICIYLICYFVYKIYYHLTNKLLTKLQNIDKINLYLYE